MVGKVELGTEYKMGFFGIGLPTQKGPVSVNNILPFHVLKLDEVDTDLKLSVCKFGKHFLKSWLELPPDE